MSTLELPQPAAVNGPVSLARPWSLTVEHLAYLALGVVSLIAHMWALDARALHHDETLHAAYSWYLYVGRGYIHDPLLHGPLLYYLGALGYFLFGDNDFTARLMPALAGTALTLTPYLVRRELGRPAALIAAGYLLVSPVTLYVGRFFRHDIYSVLCEVLVFAAIVRFASTRRTAWLLTGAAAFGLMLVNQETSYLFLLIMAAPLAVAFLWQVYRPGIAIVAALGVAVVALVFILPGDAKVDGSHNAVIDPATGQMQVERPGLFGWPPLATEDNSYALLVRNRADDDSGRGLFNNFVRYLIDLGRFFGHPAVLLAGGLALGTLAALGYLIWRRPGPDGRTPWALARERGAPAADVLASLGAGGRWRLALLLFLGIYLVFFSAFFTNLLGAISGVAGSLLYWLAQHNVQRGGQPGHYYLFQLGVYEPLLLIFGTLGLGLVAYDLWRRRAAFPILLVAWWAIAALGLYTWAGEKMPWLTIHLTVPLTLLSAWAAQRVIWPEKGGSAASALPRPASFVLFSALFAAIVGLSFVLMNAIVGFGKASVLPPWVVPVAALLLLVLLTAGAGLRWGWRPAAAML
ncbi:MAG: TIGR03663 family protein, partial [Chloroflexales bacterium]|nr:TIGR03663 family protein [Chloroflexales bacterium]